MVQFVIFCNKKRCSPRTLIVFLVCTFNLFRNISCFFRLEILQSMCYYLFIKLNTLVGLFLNVFVCGANKYVSLKYSSTLNNQLITNHLRMVFFILSILYQIYVFTNLFLLLAYLYCILLLSFCQIIYCMI